MKAMQIGWFFKAMEVLTKHDEKYMLKEVAATLKKNKKLLEPEADAGVAAGDGETGS